MITLRLLQLLENNHFGKIDEDLFWQKLALKKNGLFIVSIGRPQQRGYRKVQNFEIYSRGSNDVEGYKKLMEVVDFLNNSYNLCSLPAVPKYSVAQLDNVTIMPMYSPSNIGENSDGRIIWSATGSIIY